MERAKRERRRDDGNEEEERRGEAPPEFPLLPLEIIREVLLRLPVKSIGRFRCVSKLSRALSSDPEFAKTHLDLSLRNDAFRSGRRKLIVSFHNLYTVDFDSIGDGCEGIRELDAVEISYPLKDQPSFFCEIIRGLVRGRISCFGFTFEERSVMVNLSSSPYRRNWVDIVGSCNGLVCISPADGAVFMFNPTTGESKRIPDLPESGFEEEDYETFGFGFDAITDDYKVVALVSGDDVLNSSVYSLKTDSWKPLVNFPYRGSLNRSGVLVNGAIHWVASPEEDNRRVVVAFDLTSEQFKDMALPDEAEDCQHRFRGFVAGNLNGRLCIVNNCQEMHDDIWVMNEYGMASSWSRIRISVCYSFMKPLCSGKNEEETLMEVDGEMVLYNFGNDTSSSLVLKGVELRDGFEANAYIESLISPNSYGRA
ncbi:PREDICTED: F-box/kelch-repeat protein At3g06240-like [Tarenaya hassleriana]|uniref:F-box/kelch-repeat protein At3g06240-like n=1 Tax=Tarenaya hassleriana TaxID=28532 RepID=UPI00053C7E39|nr:PREDICTED: F-box/kelch-repeat protein At3g06240-like [Tarenaya hassleriana]